jgi:raffinose/stachyose/melibiose transport system substrate-binding protein
MPLSALSRRRLLQLSGAGLAAGAFGTLARPAFAQGQNIKVWDQFATEPLLSAFQKVLDNYAAASGNTIVREVQLGASIKDIAATALASGTGPDILQYSVGQGNAGLLADADLIIPMEEYAAQYNWHDRLSNIALLEASLGGQLWGAPQESEVSLFFVNKSLFDQHGWEVPTTHEEMVALAKEAKAAGIVAIAYGEQDWFPSWWAFSHVASNALGAQAAADLVFRNEGSFNVPEVVDGIEKYWVELAEAGAFVPQVTALPAADAQALFIAGGALMFMSGTWAVGAIEENMPGVELDIMPMWSFDGKPRAYPTGVGSAMYISSASRVKDEAAELINFLYEAEQARIMIEEASIIAPVEIDVSTLDLSEFQKRSVESVATGDGDPDVNQGVFVNHGLAGPTFHGLLTSGFQALSAGEKTAAQQAADLQAAWEQDNS